MNNLIKVLIKGAVIILIAAPFLFTGSLFPQEVPALKLKGNKPETRSLLPKLISLPDKYEMLKQSYNYKPADSTNDSGITVIKPKEPTLKKFKMKKSPTVAVLLSAVLPGAGQFYNESYWKIPIIGGLVGYFGYEYFRNNNLYKDYRDSYSASQTDLNPDGDFQLKTLREFYRDQRDNFVWYFLIVYVVNMVDAYIDAHLFDFDVSDEKFTKTGTVGKEYRLKFNLKF